jgi:UDP-N-acetylglucosamine 2-epimerase (non-hydrolysing)
MKVVSVVGARPQFVKAAPTSRALAPDHEEILVHTGQHYDRELSGVFFEELGVPDPAYDLGVGSAPHAEQTAAMLSGIGEVVDAEKPDVVLVYGDTNSTLAAAVAAAKADTLLAHVEAGLRSGDMGMPEEVNRRLTDHCSDVLFAPSPSAVDALAAESVPGEVYETGDVMYDALTYVRDRALTESDALSKFDVHEGKYVLATAHRAKNTDHRDRLAGIVDGLASVDAPVVFPAHPRTTEALRRFGLYDRATNALTLVDPVGYVDFLRLVVGARAVATDSGGVQKEAFYLDTPCVTMRDQTEWTETVDAGWNTLVGADTDRIQIALADADDPPPKPDLYGDGQAADRIAKILTQWE